jgi:hypothetical protein
MIITVVNHFIMTKADIGHALIFPAYEAPFAKILRKYHVYEEQREPRKFVNLMQQ